MNKRSFFKHQMQTKKQDIKERIWQAALEEFYDRSYRSATMRGIAKRAQITVGLIYTYYEGKEALFDEIVSPVLNYIQDKFRETYHLLGDERMVAESGMLRHVLKWPREVVILFERSEGSKYEKVRERLLETFAHHIERNMKIIRPDYCEVYSKILAACYIESTLIVARDYKDEHWAEKSVQFIDDLLFYKLS